MGAQGMNVEQLVEKLGRSGFTVIFEVEDERMVEGGEPWTLVMPGPGVGPEGFIRAEFTIHDRLSRTAIHQVAFSAR